MGVILRAHPVRGESHIQHNANREVATERTTNSLFVAHSCELMQPEALFLRHKQPSMCALLRREEQHLNSIFRWSDFSSQAPIIAFPQWS